MMGRFRACAVALSACVFAWALAAACTDTNGLSSGGAPSCDGAACADGGAGGVDSSGEEAGIILPPDVDPDAGTEDAAAVPDGGGRIDGGSCTTCDCDNDSYGGVGGACVIDGGAVDCDDYDPYIHPGQGFVIGSWDTASPHSPPFDWNCDGTVTKQFNYGVTCSDVNNCGEGFAGNPSCGASDVYNICKLTTVLLTKSCAIANSEPLGSRVQGCR